MRWAAVVGLLAAGLAMCTGIVVCPTVAADERRRPTLRRAGEREERQVGADHVGASLVEESEVEEFEDEPGARALYEGMRETIRQAESLYWESEYRRWFGGEELGHCTYRVWLKKPNYARVEATKDGELRGVLVLDGEHSWTHWPSGRYYRWGFEDDATYERTRFESYLKEAAPVGLYSINHRTQRLNAGMHMTIVDPSFFHGTPDLHAHLDGARKIGEERIGEEECDVVEASFMGRQRSHYLWISRRDRLPRKIREVVRTTEESVTEELWTNVQVNRATSDDLFVWEPPAGWERFRFPGWEEGLLKPGTVAPDFELPAVDGSRIRLSDYRGKVVWLCFWRVGCPPCRREMPQLEELHKRSSEEGLVVIGFDVADDRGIALDFLREHGVTFRNIVDSSEAARTIAHERYQNQRIVVAVPCNYIIDREGRVADAFYGDEMDRGRAVLKELAIE